MDRLPPLASTSPLAALAALFLVASLWTPTLSTPAQAATVTIAAPYAPVLM